MKLNIGNPDSFWSYVVVACAMVIHFTIFGTALSFSIFLKVLMNEFHSSRSTTAWFNSIQSGIFYFSGPIVSLLLKRYNWRILIIIGAILNGVGLSISFFAQSVYFLYGSIGIFVGIGYGLIHISTVVAVGAYFNKMNERSFAQACSLTGGTIGTLIMPLVTYKLIDMYGFRGAFLILGALMFQITLFGCLIPPLNPIADLRPIGRTKIAYSLPAITYSIANLGTKIYEQKKKILNDTIDPNPTDELLENDVDQEETLPYYSRLLSLKNSAGRRFTFAAPMTYEVALENSSHTLEAVRSDKLKHSDLFRNPKCLIFVLMSAAWNSSVVIIMHLLFDFLLVDRAVKPAINAAWITCIIMISAMIGNFLASLLGIFSSAELPSNDSDAYSKLSCAQKMLGSKYFKSWVFNITTVIHGLVATPLFLVSKRFDILCMVAALFGCPLGIKMALGPTICVDLFGVQNLPFIYGYTMMASGAGILISPPLGGYLADMTKNYNVTFCLSALLSTISFFMFSIQLIVEERKERKGIIRRKI